MNDTNEIIVDMKTIKALAVNTRLKILEELAIKPRTLSDLSSLLHLSSATIKEHLNAMIEASLISKQSEPHKFKYYSVTAKGSRIVNPHSTSVKFVLFALLFAIVILSLIFVRVFFTTIFYYNSLYKFSQSLQSRAIVAVSEKKAPVSQGNLGENTIKPIKIVSQNKTLVHNATLATKTSLSNPLSANVSANLSKVSAVHDKVEHYRNLFYRNVASMFGITVVFFSLIFLFGFFLGRSKANKNF